MSGSYSEAGKDVQRAALIFTGEPIDDELLPEPYNVHRSKATASWRVSAVGDLQAITVVAWDHDREGRVIVVRQPGEENEIKLIGSMQHELMVALRAARVWREDR